MKRIAQPAFFDHTALGETGSSDRCGAAFAAAVRRGAAGRDVAIRACLAGSEIPAAAARRAAAIRAAATEC